jgi:hypothetical protein
VDEFISDAPRFAVYKRGLGETLADWHSAGLALGPLIDRSPALQEARPLVNNLSDISQVGLEAMVYLSAGETPTGQWRDAQLAKLDEAAKPKAALEFVIVPSIRKLVFAAAELSQLKATNPLEWKKRVMMLAAAGSK